MHHVQVNIEKIKRCMENACKRAGRDPVEVQLMVVTKGRTLEEIKMASASGLRLFGENRVQEAFEKWKQSRQWFRQCRGELHMIGHLQTNKVKEAVELFDVIESVDSFRLLFKIHQEAAKIQKKVPVFIQINISEDPKKFGILPSGVLQFFRSANPMLVTGVVEVRGLMTIVGHTENIEARRPYFKRIKNLFDELRGIFQEGHIEHVNLKHLSMGMTEDFETAIEEGATIVRIGRAIFEQP